MLETNAKLIEVVTKVPDLAKTVPSAMNKQRPFTPMKSPSKEETENAIKKSKAATTLQSWWKMVETKKKMPKEETDLLKKVKQTPTTERELLGFFFLFLKSKRMNWEAFYRLCEEDDEETKEGTKNRKISHKQFSETILQLLRLPLNTTKVQKLIITFDEDNTGSISYEDYCQALEGYGFSTDKYKNAKISYAQECMAKLVGVLKRRTIEPSTFFNSCSNERGNSIMASSSGFNNIVSSQSFSTSLINLNAGFLKREISCLLRYLDTKSTGQVTKDEFLLLCKSGEALWKVLNTKASMAVTRAQIVQQKTQEIARQMEEIVKKMETSGLPIRKFCAALEVIFIFFKVSFISQIIINIIHKRDYIIYPLI